MPLPNTSPAMSPMPATREVLALDVDADFAEVALDAFPGAARGDGHFLVVVAGRAAGGEGIAEPEAVFLRNGVGDVGKGRGALVGRDHEVGIVAVVAHHARPAATIFSSTMLSVRSSRPRISV